MQILYTNKVKMIDKKYFHKTDYAKIFKLKFDTDLLENKVQFETTYWSYKTLFEFNNLLSYYQLSKIKIDKAITIFETCNKNINSKITKCYDKYCIQIYEYLMTCYEEVLETKKLGRKPNWNFFVKSIKPYIENINARMLLSYTPQPKTKEIKEKDAFYSLKDENDFDNIQQTYSKVYSSEIKGKELVFFFDLLYLSCRIHDLLYNNVSNPNIASVFKEDFILNYVENHKQAKEILDKMIIENYNNIETISTLLNAYFNEYTEPISKNNEIIDSYNMLKIVHKSIKNNDISTAKIIIKEILRKHKVFLDEE